MPKTSQSSRILQYAYSPLSISSGIEVKGNVPATQEYDIAAGLHTPDYTTEPLILAPWLDVADPDSLILPAEKVPSDIQWTAIENKAATAIGASTTGYTVAPDGTLTVKRNVTPDYPLTLRCDFDFIDPRTDALHHRSETIVIVADAVSARPLLTLDAPPVILYDPVRDTTPTKKVKATFRLGSTEIPAANRRYIWEKRDSDMVWAVISATELMDYDVSVSADGTELTIRADHIGRRIDIRCHALYNPFGSPASMTVTTDTPMQEFAVVRHEATLKALVDLPQRIHPSAKTIYPVARVYDTKGEILNPDTTCEIGWRTATGTAAGTISFGSIVARGQKPSIPVTFMHRRYGGQIKPQATVKAPLHAAKSGNSILTVNGAVLLLRPQKLT